MSDFNSESNIVEPFELINDSTNGSNEKLFIPSTSSTESIQTQSISENGNLKMDSDKLDINQVTTEITSKSVIEENSANLNEQEKNEIVNIEVCKSTTLSNVDNLKPTQALSNSFKNLDDNLSFFSWLSNNEFLNKVVEKASKSVDTVITTLDPGMKKILCNDEYYAGGDINIIVTSQNEYNINSITDAFLDVFKKATVKEFRLQSIDIPVQLIGIESAKKISIQRIQSLRENISLIAQNQVIISIDNFMYNFGEDRWFDSDYFLLEDPLNKIQIEVHTQGTPIDIKYINELKIRSSNDYKYRELGFDIRLDKVIADDLKCSVEDWHQAYVGFDKQNLFYHASFLLSNLYKNKLRSIGRNI